MPAGSSPTRRLLTEVARFLTVGGLATAVSVIGFNALVHGLVVDRAPLADRPITAFVLANVTAGLVAYVGMRLGAFADRVVAQPVRSLVRFFVLGALTMAVPVLCLAVSRYVLGLSSVWADNVAGNVIGLGVSTVLRFWLFRRYVFVAAEPVVSEPPEGGTGDPGDMRAVGARTRS